MHDFTVENCRRPIQDGKMQDLYVARIVVLPYGGRDELSDDECKALIFEILLKSWGFGSATWTHSEQKGCRERRRYNVKRLTVSLEQIWCRLRIEKGVIGIYYVRG